MTSWPAFESPRDIVVRRLVVWRRGEGEVVGQLPPAGVFAAADLLDEAAREDDDAVGGVGGALFGIERIETAKRKAGLGQGRGRIRPCVARGFRQGRGRGVRGEGRGGPAAIGTASGFLQVDDGLLDAGLVDVLVACGEGAEEGLQGEVLHEARDASAVVKEGGDGLG